MFQPYLAFLAALLALALYRLAGLVLVSRPARAVAALLAAQAALLYGYSLWGGVKEVAAAALVALAAALTSETFKARGSALALLPLGIAAAALVGVLSIGAAVWLVPAFGVVGFMLIRRRARVRPIALAAVGAALLVPSLAVARLMFGEGVLSSVRDEAELGNLVHALSPLQLFGIWPVGDFRFRPERMNEAYVLIALLAVFASRRTPGRRGSSRLGAAAVRGRRGRCGRSVRRHGVAVDRGQGAGNRLPRRGAGGRRRRAGTPWRPPGGRRCRPRLDRPRHRLVERTCVRRRDAGAAGPAGGARGDRRAVRRSGSRADDRVPAVRRPSLPPRARRRRSIGAPAEPDPAPRRNHRPEGRLRRSRGVQPRRSARVPHAGPAPDTGRQPPSRAVPARLATPLLRGLAAP